jgi:hypothetical protein
VGEKEEQGLIEKFISVLEEFVKEGRNRVALQEVFIRYKRKFGEPNWRDFKYMAKRAEEEGYWIRKDIFFEFVKEKF